MKILPISVLVVGAFVLTLGSVACSTRKSANPEVESTASRPGSAPVAHGKSPVTTSVDRN